MRKPVGQPWAHTSDLVEAENASRTAIVDRSLNGTTAMSPPDSLQGQSALPTAPTQDALDDKYYAEACQSLIFSAIHRFGIGPDSAEDIVQEVFLRYFTGPTRIPSIDAWLRNAVFFACMDHQKRHLRSTSNEASLADEYEVSSDQSQRTEDRILLAELFGRLDSRTQRALSLYYFEGRSAKEIANIFNSTPSYIEGLLATSLQEARMALSKSSKRIP